MSGGAGDRPDARANGLTGWLAGEARAALAGLMFLTRVPVPRWVGHDAAYLARSTAYFPLVGVLVGLAGGAVYWAAGRVWTALLAAVLSTAATVWLTGAFHEDALADSLDGFGGGWGRDQVLAIMKDSRVGSYALVGVTLALLAKVGALLQIDGVHPGPSESAAVVARALVAGHVLGRWSSLPLIRWLPYAREGDAAGPAKSRPFAASVTPGRLAAGTLTAVAAVAVALAPLGWDTTGLVLAAAALVTLGAGRYFRRRLGGMTGDCLGAANQGVELVTYLLLASHWLRV